MYASTLPGSSILTCHLPRTYEEIRALVGPRREEAGEDQPNYPPVLSSEAGTGRWRTTRRRMRTIPTFHHW